MPTIKTYFTRVPFYNAFIRKKGYPLSFHPKRVTWVGKKLSFFSQNSLR
jgi:hypothetical protein